MRPKPMRSRNAAWGTTRGSAAATPSTSVKMSTRSAPSATPIATPEVSLAPIPVVHRRSIQDQGSRSTIGLLRFSRVGFTRREVQALVYVEEERLDGTGGGFLVWMYRRGKVWTIADTEVLWMARPDEPEPGSP